MNRALISKEPGKRLKEQGIFCFKLQAKKIIEFWRMPST
jgi:hypothetical protein